MSQDLRIALTTSLNDQLVGPLKRSLGEVEANLKRLERELRGTDRAGKQVGTTLAGVRGPEMAAKHAAELARNTQQAIGLADRLKSAWSAAGNMVRGVAAGVAAFQAARMVVAPALQTQRSYGRQLADASNTAFSDRDTAGRQAGVKELDATVVASMRAGGGKREEVLGALNDMLASGTVSAEQAKNLLPTAARYATAGNASIGEISTIVVRALQNGFKEADIPRVLDMALASGQAGGFELKDMAKWLPKFLASSQMSGLTGFDGYARVLASAQGSVITAGSKDEAGNNLQNLLLKINSADTAQDAKKLGIDLAGSLAAAKAKGTNSLDAFVNLVDQIAGKDPRLVKLRHQAAAAGTDEERKANFDAQASILQGSAIGKIVQDRQALMPLIAELNKREYIQGVRKTVQGARGQYGDSNFELISRTDDFRVQQSENEKLIAQGNGISGANGAIAKLAEATTDLYRKYPILGENMEATKLALQGLAAAAAGAGAALFLLGGGKALVARGAGAVAGAAGAAASGAAGSAATAAGGAAAAAGGAPALLAAGLVAAPFVAAGAAARAYGNSGDGLSKRIGSQSDRLRFLDQQIRVKEAMGESPESMRRVLGERARLASERGALLGQLGGAADNGEMARLLQRSVEAQEKNAQAIEALGKRPVQATVQIDGRDVAASTNAQNAVQARRQ